MEKEAVNAYSPLVLAYLGDAVFELEIRARLVEKSNSRPNILNRKASALVCASSQSDMAEKILPLLTEEEVSILRRGRNANSPTMAKNQSVADYRRATGFEALIGYLYLSGQKERMKELIAAAVEGRSELL
ncbi:MAG: ribonuclease III [Lachnospiraceae bacterium]|nr:ribonuclease III [Lachnospiraceae bacterium]MCI1727462.1 ribonuclease III [Lachnospiraceae bacterium]